MSASAKTFEDLIVWQKAHALVLDVYRVSKGFPKDEMFGLTSQLRRAAVSVPSNIVDGFNRTGTADKLKFYNYAEAKSIQESGKEVTRILTAYTRSIKAT